MGHIGRLRVSLRDAVTVTMRPTPSLFEGAFRLTTGSGACSVLMFTDDLPIGSRLRFDGIVCVRSEATEIVPRR